MKLIFSAFKGWSKEEIKEFALALILTILFCSLVMYAGSLLENTRRPYHYDALTEHVA